MDLARFYAVLKDIEKNEDAQRKAKQNLAQLYATLVPECPHSEAVQIQSDIRGVGPKRMCKICGVVDNASKGGTPGDEYDYGYPGRPDESFWGDAIVEHTEDTDYFSSFRRQHSWIVRDGKATLQW